MPFFIVLALLLILLAVLFALQNTNPVTVQFFSLVIEERLALLLLLTLAVGLLGGVLVCIPAIVKRSLRLAKHRRSLEDMGWEVQQQQEATTAQQIRTEEVRRANDELLTALQLTEPTTGLINGEWVVSGVSHRLRSSETPTSVFVLDVHPADATLPVAPSQQQQLFRVIAAQLHRLSPAHAWFYHDGKGRFSSVITGLDTKTASAYGETLRAELGDRPLPLTDGSSLPISISIGGAISRLGEPLDSHTLLQQAEEALEQAKRRGRNRFRLVEAKAQR